MAVNINQSDIYNFGQAIGDQSSQYIDPDASMLELE